CSGIALIVVLWGINGLAQAFLWPPLVRLNAYLFDSEEYSRASVRMFWGSSGGTILLYLVSPLIITVLNWKFVFWIAGVLGLIMCFVWQGLCCRVEHEREGKRASAAGSGPGEKTPLGFPFLLMLLMIMLANICQGVLRDGVATWMPSLISETYHLSNQVSILTGVLLPIFGIGCVQLSSLINRRLVKNPITLGCVLFAVSTVSALALYLFIGASPVVSVLFSALLNACAHGINLMLVVMTPPVFKSRGNVSLMSGVLNSCTYIGSSISTYGIAYLSEKNGWSSSLLMWVLLAALGTVLCIVSIRPWSHYSEKIPDELPPRAYRKTGEQ
ncbi:MAG: MFS transporter, partial [Clostridia bacterium]|nr:MFS transporter [Clostridia bacterium]